VSQTINPSLLDRSSESTNGSFGTKGRFTFEAPMNRRLVSHGQDGEIRRQQTRNSDLLHRARDLGMKIWALEKLQRMMTVMFEEDGGLQTLHGHNTRGNSVSGTALDIRASREAVLSQLLRNERINGPSDRDPTVATKELTIFKGQFIYIRDIDEKQRPIMVRDYAKVANKHEGDWPQFRSVAGGKCPFVPEADMTRRDVEKELQRQQEKEKALVPRTRAAAAVEASHMEPPRTTRRELSEMAGGLNKSATVTTNQSNPFDSRRESSSRGQQNAFVSRAGGGLLFAGEPVASGLQPSNLTSAIRSQMYSSTAAQPGAKAGTSKEMHGLQRKVLEKNSGGPASYGQHMVVRPTKRKLGLIEEDVDPSEAEENARKAETVRKAKAVQLRKVEKRDAKPGYCENCQDKFEDFDEVC
jgi:regulatory subunit for Cdc7p protein kinase